MACSKGAGSTELSTLTTLTEYNKRWIVFGIALNYVLTPSMRRIVEQEILKEYEDLKLNHGIDVQTTHSFPVPKYPTRNGMKYENINGNDTKLKPPQYRSYDYANFDYKVTSHVDFAKLFLQSHMAKLNAFNDSCDASAVLNLFVRIPVFSATLQNAANVVREGRNAWGHCNFMEWNETNFTKRFDDMKQLVSQVGLSSADEAKVLENLTDWKDKGVKYCMNSGSVELTKQVLVHARELVNEVKEMKFQDKEQLVLGVPPALDDIQLTDELPDVGQPITKLKQESLNIGNAKLLTKCDFKGNIDKLNASFHPGTRNWLLKKVDHWFECKDPNSQVMILTADAGFGKSAFAAKVCKEYEERRQLAASHFCKSSISDYSDPCKMLESLASHLCESVNGFGEKLAEQLQRSHSITTIGDAFRVFLKEPLNSLPDQNRNILIVIDGLDESVSREKKHLLNVIEEEFQMLPKWVRIFITSRPELPTKEKLECLNHVEILRSDKDNQEDLKCYLVSCLKDRHDVDEIMLQIDAMVERCEGSFLYAYYYQLEHGELNSLTDAWNVVPKGIGSIYRRYFDRLEKELNEVVFGVEFERLLEILFAMKDAFPLSFIAKILKLPGDTHTMREVINKVNECLSALLPVYEDRITVFHKTVSDWLDADGQYGKHSFSVSRQDANKSLWQACRQMLEQINGNGRKQEELQAEEYALRHGLHHLYAITFDSVLLAAIVIHLRDLMELPKFSGDCGWLVFKDNKNVYVMTSNNVVQHIQCDQVGHAMKILVYHCEDKPLQCQAIVTKNDVVVSSNEDSALDYAVLKLNASHFVDEFPLQVSNKCLEPGDLVTIPDVLPDKCSVEFYPEDLIDWLKISSSGSSSHIPTPSCEPGINFNDAEDLKEILIPYLASFTQPGEPIFMSDSNEIVAMCSRQVFINCGKNREYFITFGVSMRKIIDDIYCKKPSEAKKWFPFFSGVDRVTGCDKKPSEARKWFPSYFGSQEVKNEDETGNKYPSTDVPTYCFSVIEGSRHPFNNSITITEKGGCFHVPIASAFLLFPPKAVEGEVTLTCSRVKYKESVKPRDGELFVSRILKVEPESVTFKKPVTVLLSHSAYEDQVFLDFYELIVEYLSPNGWKELKTERISSTEDIPKEIRKAKIFDDYLPIAKAIIHNTCTLVAATRVRSYEISVPIDRSFTFSQQYGENADLKIIFPAGVTEEILRLTIQLFPPDAVFSKDVHLDENHVVCAPVIKVSGQTAAFLKAVDVQLTYSSDDVRNITEEFLPIGNKIKFTTQYGLLLHRRKDAESTKKWENLNENKDVYIRRTRKSQLKFSFFVKHFPDIQPVVKTTFDSVIPPPRNEEVNINSAARYSAFVLAVHKTGNIPRRLYAVLAPRDQRGYLKEKWECDGLHFMGRVRDKEEIHLCVPLRDSNHLPLENCTLWFDPDDELELSNKTGDSVDLRDKNMRFLNGRKCSNGENHTTQEDCRAVVPVFISETRSAQEKTKAFDEPLPAIITKPVLESQGEKNKGDILPPESQGEKNKDNVLPPESQGEKNKENVLPPESQGEKNNDEIDDKDPIIYLLEYSRQTSDNSITIDQEGGCFSLPEVSAVLLFPPQVVEERVTLTYSEVNFKERKVKPRDGELLVSEILKIEPEGVTFKKPVTVLLSHSVYEDQVFMDFYELIVENLSPSGWKDLKTERISSSKDIPGEICNPEMLDDYLPIVKAAISETCTLVAAARVRSDRITIPTNKNYIFSKRYGKSAELKITFPAGVTKEISNLKVQLFPADTVLNNDIHLDKNLVCAPVIEVTGQTTPFLKAVDVELTYSNNDVANIDEEFLPVGNKFKFTTGYGLLLRSHDLTKSTSECETWNENNDVFIERPRKDQLKFSFSLRHFSKYSSTVKKNANVHPPNVEDNSVFSSSLSLNVSLIAIVLAVHDLDEKNLYAVLASSTKKGRLRKKWNVAATRFGPKLEDNQKIYFCVPLKNREGKFDNHLRLDANVLWFFKAMEHEVPNKTSEGVHQRWDFMYFWLEKCAGKNHDSNEEVPGKVKIHNFVKNPEKEKDKPGNISARQGVAQNAHGTAQKAHGTFQNAHGTSQNAHGTSQNAHGTCPNEVMMRRCKLFQYTIESVAQTKLKINQAFAKDPKGGKATEIAAEVAGPTTTVIVGLACGVTAAVGLPTFGAATLAGVIVTGATLAVKHVDKRRKKANAKEVENVVSKKIDEEKISSVLNYIVKDVAKELSCIYESQLFELQGDREVQILAECAVDLMLDLEKNDTFDRDTLLRKVLKDGNRNKIKYKGSLRTKKKVKWSALDVFRKPGLRQMIFGRHGTEFKYSVKPEHKDCNTSTYGYRGQFLQKKEYVNRKKEGENVLVISETPATHETHEDPCKNLCQDCISNYETCISGNYFDVSDIDSEYSETEDNPYVYRPLHVLIQCPNILVWFMQFQENRPSLANFLKNKLSLLEHHLVYPVYRPHSPGKVPDLQKSDLTGSDFSHSDFIGSCLEECTFTGCVMLFANLTGATMRRSEFCKTLIGHSNLEAVDARSSNWTETSILYSRVDRMDLRGMDNYGDITWEGTNHDKAIKGKPTRFETNRSVEVPNKAHVHSEAKETDIKSFKSKSEVHSEARERQMLNRSHPREAQSTVRPESLTSNRSLPREAHSTVRPERPISNRSHPREGQSTVRLERPISNHPHPREAQSTVRPERLISNRSPPREAHSTARPERPISNRSLPREAQSTMRPERPISNHSHPREAQSTAQAKKSESSV